MADKGIRVNVNHKFVEMLPQRSEMGNTAFRKAVICYAMDEFGITLASAATHYNHAFKEARKIADLVPLLEGLGRPEDKKGGRKPKVRAEAVAEVPEQTEFSVYKKRTGELVAEKLNFEDARAMVVKAKAAKKAALYWV